MRGGSAESRRGIRSIVKVDENPCARSNILAGVKKTKKLKKTEKSWKLWKMMKMRGGSKRCPQVVQNKAFGEGPKSPRAARQRSEVKFRQKIEFFSWNTYWESLREKQNFTKSRLREQDEKWCHLRKTHFPCEICTAFSGEVEIKRCRHDLPWSRFDEKPCTRSRFLQYVVVDDELQKVPNW